MNLREGDAIDEWKYFLEVGGRRVELSGGDVTVGRSRGCTVALPDVSVSRSHALLSLHQGRAILKDLSSSNGTYLNGQLLSEETVIGDGDRITLGETELIFWMKPPSLLAEKTARLERPGSPRPGPSSRPPEAVPPLGDGASAEPLGPAVSDMEKATFVTRPEAGEPSAGPIPYAQGAEREPGVVAGPPPAPPARDSGTAEPPRQGSVPPPEAASADGILRVESSDRVIGSAPAGGPEAAPPAPPEAARLSSEQGVREPPGEILPSIDDLDLSTPVPSAKLAKTAGGRAAQPKPKFPPAAGFWVRLAAVVIDGVWILLVAIGCSLPLGGPAEARGGMVMSGVALVLSLAVPLLGWGVWGTSPGKRLFGLYVCTVDGQVATGLGRALLRWIGYWVSGVPLGIGFLMVGLTAAKRGLHDLIAGTYVARRS